MIEIGLKAIGVGAQATDPAAIEAGLEPEVDVRVLGGLLIPVGQARAMQVPAFVVNFGMDRETALKLSDELRAEAEKLPIKAKSQIETATSLAGIEGVAKLDAQIRGGNAR